MKIHFLHSLIDYDNWPTYNLEKFTYNIEIDKDMQEISICGQYLMNFNKNGDFVLYSLFKNNFTKILEEKAKNRIESVINN